MKKNLTLVGINDSHDAAACVVRDGRLLAAVAEERPQRVKGMGGFPANAIDTCLEMSGIARDEVDYVVMGNRSVSPKNLHNVAATLSIDEYISIEENYWYPVLYEGKDPKLAEILPDYRPLGRIHYPLDQIPLAENREVDAAGLAAVQSLRARHTAAFFGIPEEKVVFVDHHTAHAYYGYFAAPRRADRDNMLVMTADAGGDGAYESVGVFENGRYRRIHVGHTNLVATIYRYATLLLGMRPNEHEYKLMGLAGYATEYHKRVPREIFTEAMTLEGLAFTRNPAVRDLFIHLRERLKACRFDGIAGGVQDFAEEFLCRWVANAIEATGIRDLVLSGGLALNVRANKRVSEMDVVDSVFVPPGAGDESLPIGACYAFLDRISDGGPGPFAGIEPMAHAYLGPDLQRADIDRLRDHPKVRELYQVRDRATPRDVAEFLKDGAICAVCAGRMEFGPRALGHRSIIADPSRLHSVRKINDAIKKRDFWMPFAPAVRTERLHDYVINEKDIPCSYMTVAFDSTETGKKDLVAGSHAADQTVRVQEVRREASPGFHAIIEAFDRMTGIGGVLNTSLNIHGKPIVMKPVEIAEEILSVDGVELDTMYVGDVLFVRK